MPGQCCRRWWRSRRKTIWRVYFAAWPGCRPLSRRAQRHSPAAVGSELRRVQRRHVCGPCRSCVPTSSWYSTPIGLSTIRHRFPTRSCGSRHLIPRSAAACRRRYGRSARRRARVCVIEGMPGLNYSPPARARHDADRDRPKVSRVHARAGAEPSRRMRLTMRFASWRAGCAAQRRSKTGDMPGRNLPVDGGWKGALWDNNHISVATMMLLAPALEECLK